MMRINLKNAFVPDERWSDYVDLLPGFASLDKETAYAIYSGTNGIDYKPAKKVFLKNGVRDVSQPIQICFGIGFVEIDSDDGVILLSKELQRTFIYKKRGRDSAALLFIARTLTTSARWAGPTRIEDRGILIGDEAPYYELGKEIESAHIKARHAEYAAIGEMETRPYFVEELKTYYQGQQHDHDNAVKEAFRSGDTKRNEWETDAGRAASQIYSHLHLCLTLNMKKVQLAKAKDTAYETLYAKLSELLKAKGEDAIPFERWFSAPPPHPAEKAETPAKEEPEPDVLRNEAEIEIEPLIEPEVEEFPTNLDNALRHIKIQLNGQKGAYERHEELRKQGKMPVPNGHYELYQKYLVAYQGLIFLRQQGIEWVGDEPGISDEKLISNIRKIRAAIEKNPDTVPAVGSLEYCSYLEQIINSENEEVAETTKKTIFALSSNKKQPTSPPKPEEKQPEKKTTAPDKAKIKGQTPTKKREWKHAKAFSSWLKFSMPLYLSVIATRSCSRAAEISSSTVSKVRIVGSFIARSAGKLRNVGQKSLRRIRDEIPTLLAIGIESIAFVVITAKRCVSLLSIGSRHAASKRANLSTSPQSAKVPNAHTKRMVLWAKTHAPELLTSAAVGYGVRAGVRKGLSISGQFALNKLMFAVPGFAASVAASPVAAAVLSVAGAMAAGALAGSVTKVAVTYYKNRKKTEDLEKGWWRTEFAKGAALGALGGLGGAIIGDIFHADGLLYSLIHTHHLPVIPHVPAAFLAPATSFDMTNHGDFYKTLLPDLNPKVPGTLNSLYSAPGVDGLNGKDAAGLLLREAPYVGLLSAVANHANAEAHASSTDLLTPEQLSKLSDKVKHLAKFKTSGGLTRFYKEASFELMNKQERTPENIKAAVDLLKKGVDVAEQSGTHSQTARQLFRDYAYMKLHGIGTPSDKQEAIKYARKAGRYGLKFLRYLWVPS